MYLKQLLFNMESDDGDVGGEPTLDERMADVEKAFYHTLRQRNPKNDEIVNTILQTIEANADKKNATLNAKKRKLEEQAAKPKKNRKKMKDILGQVIETFLQLVRELAMDTTDTEMFEDIDDDVKPYLKWVETLKYAFAATVCYGEKPVKLMKDMMKKVDPIIDEDDEEHDMFEILTEFCHALREKLEDDDDSDEWLEGLTIRLTTEEEEEKEVRVPKVGDIYQRKDVKHYEHWSGWVHHHPVTSGNKLGMGRSYQDIMLPGHKIKIVDVITRPCKAGVYHIIHFESRGGKVHGNETVSYQCYKSYYFKFKYYMELAPKKESAKPAEPAEAAKRAKKK